MKTDYNGLNVLSSGKALIRCHAVSRRQWNNESRSDKNGTPADRAAKEAVGTAERSKQKYLSLQHTLVKKNFTNMGGRLVNAHILGCLSRNDDKVMPLQFFFMAIDGLPKDPLDSISLYGRTQSLTGVHCVSRPSDVVFLKIDNHDIGDGLLSADEECFPDLPILKSGKTNALYRRPVIRGTKG